MSSWGELPALDCPFGSEISPHADQVDRSVIDWARRFGLLTEQAEISRFQQARVGRLAARTSPGSGREALNLLADWQLWLFIFDDHYCDESETGVHPVQLGRVITSFVRVLDSPGDPSARADPLTTALGDLVDRLAEAATGPQIFRFMSAVRGYFLAQFWEAGHRADDRPASLAEYQVMRRHSGAVPTCMALIDVAGGFELTDEEFCRRDVRLLTDIAVNVTCWANDILSHPKEARRNLKVHSLPSVLARERQVSVGEALSVAAAMHDAEVARYLETEPALRREGGPLLRRYLDGLRNWMGGNFHWSMETGRYGLSAAGGG
jgi:Terpene synthase family 2, C-terminal metal binding